MTPEQKERDDIAKHVAGHIYRESCSDMAGVARIAYEIADALIARGKELRKDQVDRPILHFETLEGLRAELDLAP